VIQLADVHKAFGPRTVLRGVDLDIARGTIWGLIGPAAAGKSLLLKLVAGLERADTGRVLIDGIAVGGLSEDALMQLRAQFGMLFQNGALFDFMTVERNVAFPLLRAGVQQDEAFARARERLRAVGLAGSEHKAPSELSGGMKKRAAIARATIAEAPIVLYDEPTAGLDPVTACKIYDLLRSDQARLGSTLLVVSSDVAGLRGFVSQLAMLHDGRIVWQGPSEAIEQAEPAVVRQFVRGELEGPL
jgi:phospholipid/cholesterol/gamma-HCH transport system ATP-binding protein